MVFMDHYGGGAHGGRVLQVINEVRGRGWIGVDLFFVLSGFLITGILYDTRRDSRYFLRFFARRSVRIFPIFYLVVAVLLALTPIFHYMWRPAQMFFLVYLGNIPGNWDFSLYDVLSANHPTARVTLGHFWSLCVEEQFYVIWPAIVWLVRDRLKLLWTACCICVLTLGARIWIVTHVSQYRAEQLIFRGLPFRIDTLLIGGIMALLLRGPASDAWQRSAKYFLLLGAPPVLLIFILSPQLNSPWLLSIGLTCIALASAGLIGMTVRTGSPAFRLFHLKPLRTLGRYSYGFYIYHLLYQWAWIQFLVLISHAMHSMILGGVVALTTNFAVTFLVSKFSYDFYELRFLAWKRRFQYDSENEAHRHAYSLQP